MPPRRNQSRNPDNDAAALLGDELRELRLATGYRSQEDVTVLQADRSVLGRIETGERPPTSDQLAALLDFYGTNGRLRRVYERLGRVARANVVNAPVRMWFRGYLDAEGAAHTIRVWQPLVIHGLFQTEAYATALFVAMGMTPEQVREQVEVRMRRQSILARSNPPNITLVIWEPVLNHLIGSAKVMAEQLAHLEALSRSILIQVVPEESGGNAGLGGAVSVVEGSRGTLILAESLLEDQVTQDQDTVIKGIATFDAVR
ncbi:MAG TPA: helix-turn-helix transcriptional regulator, partial [Trebonia sp.]|nr:helix-turn-helix transcriptional regulator [Trebonia sp.]